MADGDVLTKVAGHQAFAAPTSLSADIVAAAEGAASPSGANVFATMASALDQVDLDIMTAGLAGVGVVSGCAVTAQGSPNMTCAVASGVVRNADGSTVAVASGNVTITTANATNPRIDLIVVNSSGTKSVTAGVAAASPVMPAIPASSVVLAAVSVPANDTTIATNQITDKRVIFATTSGISFPVTPRPGDPFYRTDLGLDFIYDGARWVSTQIFVIPGTIAILAPYAAGSYNPIYWALSLPAGQTYYLTRLRALVHIGATNTGSHYWKVDLITRKATYADPVTIASTTTAADTAGTQVTKLVPINTVYDPATYPEARIVINVTGSPSDLGLIVADLEYQIVAS